MDSKKKWISPELSNLEVDSTEAGITPAPSEAGEFSS